MSSLLGKVMEQSGEDDKAATAAPAEAPKGLLGAMKNAEPAAAPHAEPHHAPGGLLGQLQSATPESVNAMAPEQKAQLGQVLAKSGAAEGAGVTDTSDPNAISQMLNWVQANVPGGIPGVLGALGVAGAGAAAAETGQGSNLMDEVQNIGGGLFKSVLGAVMPAINDAVSKATDKTGQ